MTKLEITLSTDLKFTIDCRDSEASKVLIKILENFNKEKDIIVRYWSKKELEFDTISFKDIYFNPKNPFYGKLKSIKIFKGDDLSDVELSILMKY